MYTGTTAQDWTALRARGAQAVQRAEAGLPWEQDGPRTGSDQDTWLLSFIDVLTLLLTLFVLLLAYQRDDGNEMSALPEPAAADIAPAAPPSPATALAPAAAVLSARVSDSAREAPAPQAGSSDSSEAAPVAAPSVVPIVRDTVPVLAAGLEPRVAASLSVPAQHPLLTLGGELAAPVMPIEPPPAPTMAEPAADRTAAPTRTDPAGQDLPLQRLLADLNGSALAGRVEVNVLPDAVNLEISDNILFAPASAALTDGGRTLLNDLAATLKTLPYALSVEGHTDNVPIRTVRYPSNWELAAARASAVTRHLIERGIAADRVRAIGYADTRPRADNTDPAGRARNRRVAFILRLPVSEAGLQTTRAAR